MAYVPVPKDLTKVKTKVAFNLTKRQLVCFTGGALLGVPLFFLLRGSAGNSTAALCMMFVMLPFFMLAMYEKHGQPLEKIVGNIIRVTVIRPRQRPYQTNNFYEEARKISFSSFCFVSATLTTRKVIRNIRSFRLCRSRRMFFASPA